MPQVDLPEILVQLASEDSVGNLGSGNFKTVAPLQTRNFVAATIKPQNLKGQTHAQVEAKIGEVLRETITALKMRIWHLEDKMRARPGVYRGGQHILKMVGYDPASGRLVMKGAGQTLEKVFPWERFGMAEYFPQRKSGRRKYFTAMLASIALQVLEALKFLQAREMIHADLKMENIMIDKMGKVTLIDVGGAGDRWHPRKAMSPGYFSDRRQAENNRSAMGYEQSDARFTEDLYALGCTLIYCCLGGNQIASARTSQFHDGALEKVGSKSLRAFVEKLMAGEKNQQPAYQTAAEAMQDPFLSKGKLASRGKIYQEYLEHFVSVSPDPAPSAASAMAAAPVTVTRTPPPQGSWDQFVRDYPTLIPLLEEATFLAAKAARMKKSMQWKSPWVRTYPKNQLS